MNINKQVAFTICAKNYIGLAQILESSIKKYNSNTDFFIFVADEMDEAEIGHGVSNILIGKKCLDIDPLVWEKMSFWYDLTSFCTAIKPHCFQWIMDNTPYENIIYFDPDIYVFNSLEYVFHELQTYSVVLTPHILHMEKQFSGDILEKGILYSGIYNLGFLAMKRSEDARKVSEWWANRLIEKCTADSLDSYFYDQRWMDFLPAFLDRKSVLISRNMGMNVAPWNFFERKIVQKEGGLYVANRHTAHSQMDKLIFVHYSGYNYSLLKGGKILQKNIKGMSTYSDINLVLDKYANELNLSRDIFNKYINLPYTYNCYDNGCKIDKFHRRLYYSLLSRGEEFAQPFSSSGKFYQLLKSRRMVSKKRAFEVDKVTHNDLDKYGDQLNYFNRFTKFLFCLVGYERYVPLLRLLKHYSKFEGQIHLVDKKYMRNNIQ